MKINNFDVEDQRLFSCYNCDNQGYFSICIDGLDKEVVLCKVCGLKLIRLLLDKLILI